jgi:hypothetical protein
VRTASPLLPLALTLVTGCDLIDRIRDEIDRRGDPGPAQPQNVPTTAPPTLPMPTQPQQPAQPGQPEALAPPPQGSYGPTGTFTQEFLQMEARVVLSELVASLTPDHRVRVQDIPLQYTANLAEVNAAAGCTRAGRSLMAVTGGMLALVSASSEAKATDELAGTQILTGYYDQTVQAVRRNQPVMPLPPGAVPPQFALDPRKLARQRFLFDEQIGFILGHELGHHYRGHTGCAGGGNATGQEAQAEEAVRMVSNTLPLFNQPVELEADAWGVVDVLDAGARRVGGRWTEEGALLSMDFFQRLEGERGMSPLLLFVRTHPPTVFRRPIIQMWADKWRRGERPTTVGQGGLPIPIPIPFPMGNAQGDGGTPTLPLPFPIPGFGNNGGQRDGGQNNGGLPIPFPIPLPTR